ncbi:MAG: PRC-barrel domain containing protein [Xanthobacteraceae bacterium]|nr:MAG: PRC-barrel domain containing protein [Xanthobacteraceae bacterium]
MEEQTTQQTRQTQRISPEAHSLIASDRVEGTPVRRSSGEKIGSIQRIMIDKLSGTVAYAVLSFGGFLGMGQKHLPVPWSRLIYDRVQQAYRLDVTDNDLLKAIAAYEADQEFDWGDRRLEAIMKGLAKSPHYWDV